MTRPVLVKAFMEGASIATLAQLLGHDAADLEAGLRQGLIEISQDQPEPRQTAPAEPETRPTPPAAPKRAGASSPRPARQKNYVAQLTKDIVRRRVESKAGDVLDLTGYPAPLQDPRAETQRAIYDALRREPHDLHALQIATGRTSSKVFQAIQKMRNKNLVRGSETTPVVWRIA